MKFFIPEKLEKLDVHNVSSDCCSPLFEFLHLEVYFIMSDFYLLNLGVNCLTRPDLKVTQIGHFNPKNLLNKI